MISIISYYKVWNFKVFSQFLNDFSFYLRILFFIILEILQLA
ncbi:hypothetical protein HMPREF1881_01984 [Streptococcus agalactiae]|nr:hypothetical protein HMPREF1881_01984 [Streptococcus agalactiae]